MVTDLVLKCEEEHRESKTRIVNVQEGRRNGQWLLNVKDISDTEAAAFSHCNGECAPHAKAGMIALNI